MGASHCAPFFQTTLISKYPFFISWCFKFKNSPNDQPLSIKSLYFVKEEFLSDFNADGNWSENIQSRFQVFFVIGLQQMKVFDSHKTMIASSCTVSP